MGASAFEMRFGRHREMTAPGAREPFSIVWTEHHFELASFNAVWATNRQHPALSRALRCWLSDFGFPLRSIGYCTFFPSACVPNLHALDT
jgi:hypothetical protein